MHCTVVHYNTVRSAAQSDAHTAHAILQDTVQCLETVQCSYVHVHSAASLAHLYN